MPRRYELNHEAFDVVTPESAYWAGFIFADGSVGARTTAGNYCQVTVTLSECDRGHLEKLRRFLGASSPIVFVQQKGKGYAGTKDAFRLCFGSLHLVDRLVSFGIVAKRPNGMLNRELAQSRDFWRGYIDGDGWVSVRQRSDSRKPCPYVGVVGQRPIVDQFVSYCRAITTANASVRPLHSIFSAMYTGCFAKLLVDHFYKNASVALDRKKVIAEQIIATDFAFKHRLSADERERIATLYSAGFSSREIAEVMNISADHVGREARRRGINRQVGRKNAATIAMMAAYQSEVRLG